MADDHYTHAEQLLRDCAETISNANNSDMPLVYAVKAQAEATLALIDKFDDIFMGKDQNGVDTSIMTLIAGLLAR